MPQASARTDHATTTHDWLAVIYIAGGSSWGRSTDKEKAIRNALDAFRDWESVFTFKRQTISIEVIDVHGYGQCWWDHSGMQGVNEATGESEKIDRPLECVKRVFVPSKKRK